METYRYDLKLDIVQKESTFLIVSEMLIAGTNIGHLQVFRKMRELIPPIKWASRDPVIALKLC